MKRILLGTLLINCAAWLASGQSTEKPPRFEAADVHASPRPANAGPLIPLPIAPGNSFTRTGPVRNGRYQVKNATMLDLIQLAYGVIPDKIVGGPSWLELDRFDVMAKLPAESTPETRNLMLQTLLEDRFKLVVHKDTKPVPAYALTAGNKPQLKEADGSGNSGCQPQTSSGPPDPGVPVLMLPGANGNPTRIVLGPGGTIEYACRNMTMAEFAAGLDRMFGVPVGPNPVLDQTELSGKWNFNMRWSIGLNGGPSVFDAMEKQLGLKLEQKPIPTQVIVVDGVNRTPGENPPGTAEALPPIPAPTEFEVASIKPTGPNARPGVRFQTQPGGRFVAEGAPLGNLMNLAFSTNNNEQIVGLPPWATTERFDITAQAPPETGLTAGMIRALLVDRFKMTYHTEERQISAYNLVAAKPKMKKADPVSRTSCKGGPSTAPGLPPGTLVVVCQNITMAQFAERLQETAPGLNWPVSDATELEGGWDFTLSFSTTAGLNLPPAGRGGAEAGQAGGPVVAPSDPSGGYTIFEAIEKQLGLKLEKQKRQEPVIVIDHIEPKPTDN